MPSFEDRDKLKCEYYGHIDIPRNNVENFMGAHMIYPLAVSSVDDRLVVGEVASLGVTI